MNKPTPTYIELAKVDFDPTSLCFDTIQEAIDFCNSQPEPFAALKALICANIDLGEYGVSGDLAHEADQIAINEVQTKAGI